MKIDEFKATLNQLAYTATNNRSGIISVYTHNHWGEDDANGWCFRLAPARKTVIVEKQWDKLDGMPVFCVRDLLNLIAELDKTPVKERFPEKKYRLRWIDDSDCSKNYIGLHRPTVNYPIIDWYITSTTDNKLNNYHELWTESELEQLKKDNPRLAPAIDAMKEEVKDDDND